MRGPPRTRAPHGTHAWDAPPDERCSAVVAGSCGSCNSLVRKGLEAWAVTRGFERPRGTGTVASQPQGRARTNAHTPPCAFSTQQQQHSKQHEQDGQGPGLQRVRPGKGQNSGLQPVRQGKGHAAALQPVRQGKLGGLGLGPSGARSRACGSTRSGPTGAAVKHLLRRLCSPLHACPTSQRKGVMQRQQRESVSREPGTSPRCLNADLQNSDRERRRERGLSANSERVLANSEQRTAALALQRVLALVSCELGSTVCDSYSDQRSGHLCVLGPTKGARQTSLVEPGRRHPIFFVLQLWPALETAIAYRGSLYPLRQCPATRPRPLRRPKRYTRPSGASNRVRPPRTTGRQWAVGVAAVRRFPLSTFFSHTSRQLA